VSGVTPCLPLLPVTSHLGCNIYVHVETVFSVRYVLKCKRRDDENGDNDNNNNNNSRNSLLWLQKLFVIFLKIFWSTMPLSHLANLLQSFGYEIRIRTYIRTYVSYSISQWPRGLRPLSGWDCGFESHRGHGCLSAVSVVCCQVAVSATGRSLVQISPTECVCVCVCVCAWVCHWVWSGVTITLYTHSE